MINLSKTIEKIFCKKPVKSCNCNEEKFSVHVFGSRGKKDFDAILCKKHIKIECERGYFVSFN
jgi:hypothetical protein